MMWLRGSYWVPYVLSCGTRASAALPSEQTPLLLRYHRIKLLRNREIISRSIQVKQVKGSSFHELGNHSESFRIMSSLFGIHSLTLSSPMSHHFLGAFLDLINNQSMSSLHIPKCFPSIPSIFL